MNVIGAGTGVRGEQVHGVSVFEDGGIEKRPSPFGEAGTVSGRMDSDAIVIQFIWANILSISPFHSVAVSRNAFEISRIGKLPIPVSADIGLYIKIPCFPVIKGHAKHIVLHGNNGFCRWTQHSGHLFSSSAERLNFEIPLTIAQQVPVSQQFILVNGHPRK